MLAVAVAIVSSSFLCFLPNQIYGLFCATQQDLTSMTLMNIMRNTRVSESKMDILEEFQVIEDMENLLDQEEGEIGRRRRKFKNRTCEFFFDEMTDFECLRTFRFTKEGVRHLTTLLGNVKS